MKKILSAALVLMLVFSLSISAFAITLDFENFDYPTQVLFGGSLSPLTNWLNDSNNYTQMFVRTNDSGVTYLHLVQGNLKVDDSGKIVSYSDGDRMNHAYFQLDVQSWKHVGTQTIVQNHSLANLSQLDWSANDIYYINGELAVEGDSNFPLPLADQVQEVTAQAMLEEAMKMTKTMGLLTVFAIGLMALLIGSALFGKRSLLFRS